MVSTSRQYAFPQFVETTVDLKYFQIFCCTFHPRHIHFCHTDAVMSSSEPQQSNPPMIRGLCRAAREEVMRRYTVVLRRSMPELQNSFEATHVGKPI